jgi:hypothetical protein
MSWRDRLVSRVAVFMPEGLYAGAAGDRAVPRSGHDMSCPYNSPVLHQYEAFSSINQVPNSINEAFSSINNVIFNHKLRGNKRGNSQRAKSPFCFSF